jgi:hypothetical protein
MDSSVSAAPGMAGGRAAHPWSGLRVDFDAELFAWVALSLLLVGLGAMETVKVRPRTAARVLGGLAAASGLALFDRAMARVEGLAGLDMILLFCAGFAACQLGTWWLDTVRKREPLPLHRRGTTPVIAETNAFLAARITACAVVGASVVLLLTPFLQAAGPAGG